MHSATASVRKEGVRRPGERDTDAPLRCRRERPEQSTRKARTSHNPTETMRIYITTQGSAVVKEGGHLLVRLGKDTHRTIFVHKVSQVILCGNVTLTPPARAMLCKNGIDVAFLTKNGRYLGRLASPEPKNIELRKRQFRLADDPAFGLAFARAVATGKLANQAAVLMRIQRKRDDRRPAEAARRLRALAERAETAESIEALRGYEGEGGAIYFSQFNRGFDEDQGFVKRVRRPPTDPVNAVLSLLYTFLYNQVYSAVRQVHLDPYLGYLHAHDYGRFSLVLDLMEEFRPVIVDTLVFALFNMRTLKRDEDFRIEEENEAEEDAEEAPVGQAGESGNEFFDTPVQRMEERFVMPPVAALGKRPVLLRPEAMKRVIAQFERKLATGFTYEPEDRKITYAEAMVRQARQYRRCVEGERSVYAPLALR